MKKVVYVVILAVLLTVDCTSQTKSPDKTPTKVEMKEPELCWTIDDLPSTSSVSAAVGDITGDEKPEIVFGTYCGGNRVYAVDGIKGKILWEYQVAKHPKCGCIDDAAALYDINGDNKKEVFFGSTMTKDFFCLSGESKVVWKYKISEQAIFDSACAIGDIDGDKKPEVVFGITGNVDRKAGKFGAIYALTADEGKFLWKTYFGGQCQCEPVLVDLDGDKVLDVVVTIHWESPRTGSDGKKIFGLSGKDGSELWVYKTGKYNQYHNVSVGDLNGDGQTELAIATTEKIILLTTGGKLIWDFQADCAIPGPTTMADLDNDKRLELVFVDAAGTCYCLKDERGKPNLLWKTPTREDPTKGRREEDAFRGVAVADVSGDGKLDVVFCTVHDQKLHILNGADGSSFWEFRTEGPAGDTRTYVPRTVPVIADLDGDGKMEIFLVAGSQMHPSQNPPETYGRVFCFKTAGTGPEWTMFRRDLTHHGCVPIK